MKIQLQHKKDQISYSHVMLVIRSIRQLVFLLCKSEFRYSMHTVFRKVLYECQISSESQTSTLVQVTVYALDLSPVTNLQVLSYKSSSDTYHLGLLFKKLSCGTAIISRIKTFLILERKETKVFMRSPSCLSLIRQ